MKVFEIVEWKQLKADAKAAKAKGMVAATDAMERAMKLQSFMAIKPFFFSFHKDVKEPFIEFCVKEADYRGIGIDTWWYKVLSDGTYQRNRNSHAAKKYTPAKEMHAKLGDLASDVIPFDAAFKDIKRQIDFEIKIWRSLDEN